MVILVRRFQVYLFLGLLPVGFAAFCSSGRSDGPGAKEKATVTDTRIYLFTARIKANGGVLPFRVGSFVRGQIQ